MVSDVQKTSQNKTGFRFVLEPVDQHVLTVLDSFKSEDDFKLLRDDRPKSLTLGPGDGLQLSIYQVDAAGAFTQNQMSSVAVQGGGQGAAPLPKAYMSGLTIGEDGYISVPYAGRVHIAGLTIDGAQKLIENRLRNMLTDPQVSLNVVANASNLVTVTGAVKVPGRYPLSSAGETLVDILATAGGSLSQQSDTWLEVTRRGQLISVPLQKLLRMPAANIHVDKGDLINVVVKARTYQVFGAAKQPSEYPVRDDDDGETVAKGLAHAGGLIDSQADSRGVFLFRYERPKVVEEFKQPLQVIQAEAQPLVDPVTGRVPVVYAFDMSKPKGYFMAMHFQMQSGDVLFISNARLVEWLKVINLLGTFTQAGSRGASMGGGF